MKKIYTLNRNEIIRGFEKFEYILENGTKFQNGYLSAILKVNEIDSGLNLKVGFLLSKKKLENLTKETV